MHNEGILLSPVNEKSTYLTVSNYLHESLVPGDHLLLKYGDTVEVVLITHKNSYSVGVYRGRDNTEAGVFPTGTTLRKTTVTSDFRPTPNRVEIHTPDKVDPLSLTTHLNAASVLNGKLDVPHINIQHGSAHYTIGGTSSISIGRQEDAYGCCGGEEETAPLDGKIFYLVSKPYPIKTVEAFTTHTSLISAVVRPSTVEKLLVNPVSFQAGELREPVLYYNITDRLDGISLGFVEGSLVEPVKKITLPSEKLSSGTVAITGGTLRVAVISYTNGAPERLQSTIQFLSGTLT